jgi:ATP-dependent Clp protease ATP-binding subunit ClpA
VDLGTVAVVAVVAGFAGGAVGAALVGTVEGMLRQRQTHADRGWRSNLVRARSAQPTPRGDGPFEDFNDRAKRVLALSQDEATRFNHRSIGTEHLLLGLSREGEGVAARVLESMGATLPKLRAAVEPKRGMTTVEKPELSDTSKTAISNARAEARKLGHSHVGTEHLLLGLVREHGAGVALLRELDIDAEQVRHSVIATLGQPQPSVPIDRLDVDSRKVVTLARQEAIQSGHSYIGSENLAMALRLYSTPTLDNVWSQLRIDSEVLRRRIEAAVPPTLGVFPTEGSWTQRVARIVRMAHGIAAQRQRDEVAPEHLLIALAAEGGGAGADVLASLGATPQRIREIVDGPKS